MKVFVTVGTQLPFDRLIVAVDRWAAQNPHVEITAQTCTSPSAYRATHFKRIHTMLDAADCDRIMADSDVTIAHAGMGTILTAMDLNKRLIVMPRRASLGEHRNDHQWATTQRLSAAGLIEVANDEAELAELLASTTARAELRAARTEPKRALVDALNEFVWKSAGPPKNRLKSLVVTLRRGGTSQSSKVNA